MLKSFLGKDTFEMQNQKIYASEYENFIDMAS